MVMQNRNDSNLYPLKFNPLPKEKVWGGHKLARLFDQEVPADRQIGEAWVVWDQLTVANGALQGQVLAALIRAHPQQLLGRRLVAGGEPTFPLLVKLLDARETLSVQVHPDDNYAREREGQPYGKSEMWYILDTEPGAHLIHGVARPVTRGEVRRAIASGSLQEMLADVEVAPGDVVLNLPGTIHAIGAGIFLYELQQSSDLTYRFYDWDRNDPSRPLHIEQSLDVADLDPYLNHCVQPVEIREGDATRTYLCACAYFAAELLTVQSRIQERPAGECFHILTAIQGAGRVQVGPIPATERSEAAVPLRAGESVLVPAAIPEYSLSATQPPLRVIKGYIPDLLRDIVLPLQAQEVPDEAIRQLGGDPGKSDLGPYLDQQSLPA